MENLKKVRAIFKSSALSSVAHWSKCVRGRLTAVCLLTVLSTLLSLGTTLVTRGLIDGAVSSRMDALQRYGILLLMLILTQRVISLSVSFLNAGAHARLQKYLQGMLMRELLSREYADLKKYHSGEMVNRVFSDMGVVKNGVLTILPGFVQTVVSFVGASAILIAMDWRFVLLLVAGGLVGLGLVILFRQPLKRRHRRVQEAESALHVSVQETLENIRLIKASVSGDRVLRKIHNCQENLAEEQVRQSRFSAGMNNSMGTVFDFSWLFCMLWGCASIYHGRLTYGSLAALIQLIGRIQGPIANAVGMASRAYGVISSAERLEELMGLPAEAGGESLPDFEELCLEGVYFRYDDGTEDVLKDISCSVRRGEFMALTGISGGGKTSLFQLLLGIYRPTAGKIVLRQGTAEGDAGSGREVCVSGGTRNLFAYVPQGNSLFSGTLRENLTLFTDFASDEDIRRAAQAACIGRLLTDIGPDAMLGERGIGLSEGQAQRVAIARALLSKAPILLLDEATSALDEETEAQLLQNLSAMKDKTCIIVTHRKAALAICHRRLHLSGGRAADPPD